MRRLNWIGMAAVWILGAVFLAGSAQAAKVAVVDTAKVVKEYQKTKDSQERLEKELDDKKNELQKMSTELDAEKADLDRQKGIVSEAKYKKLEEKFNKKQDTFRDKYRETQTALMSKQRTLMEGIVNDVKEIVAQIAKSDKYELVLDKETVLYYDGDDITYKVLDKLNAKK